jgi:hypothetical protein
MGIRQTTEPEALLVKPREAARLLGFSERTLYAVTVPRGSLRCLRVDTDSSRAAGNGFLRYAVEDLRAWIQENHQLPAGPDDK